MQAHAVERVANLDAVRSNGKQGKVRRERDSLYDVSRARGRERLTAPTSPSAAMSGLLNALRTGINACETAKYDSGCRRVCNAYSAMEQNMTRPVHAARGNIHVQLRAGNEAVGVHCYSQLQAQATVRERVRSGSEGASAVNAER